jgi:hypothetical protein
MEYVSSVQAKKSNRGQFAAVFLCKTVGQANESFSTGEDRHFGLHPGQVEIHQG